MKLSIAPLVGGLLLMACAGEDSGAGTDPVVQDAGAGGATSGAGGGTSSGGIRGTACVVQEVQACTPLSGCSGTRTCLLNQSGYGPCVCTPPPEAGTDADGATPDAQADSGPEAGLEAGPDVGSDAGPEAGSGGSSSADASSGGAPSAGGASSGDAATDGASSGDAEAGD